MKELIAKIRQSQKIVLASHVYPDGDAVGSLLGLTLGLQGSEKQVSAYLHDGVPEIFHFLPDVNLIQTDPLPQDADLCILLDMPDAARSAYASTVRAYAKRNSLAFVDHHPAGDLTNLTTVNLTRNEVSSTSELVFQLLLELGSKITPEIAQSLLTGMYTDTGGFQYTNTRETTMQRAAELMRRGARLNKIVQHISHEKSVATLKLIGLALERLQVTWQGRCALSVLTSEDMQEIGAKDEDLTGVINELNTLSGVKFTLLLTELQKGEVRGSFRTADGSYFNVAALARVMGGGGHPRAAGFTVPGTIVRTGNSWQITDFSGTVE